MATSCVRPAGLAPDASPVVSTFCKCRRMKLAPINSPVVGNWTSSSHELPSSVFAQIPLLINRPQHRGIFYAVPPPLLRRIRDEYRVELSSHRRRISAECKATILSTSKGYEWGHVGSSWTEGSRRNRIGCKAGPRDSVGSSEWMSRATPYEVLGISADSSEEEIKTAFRVKIKEYHPDVYQGLGDADAITQRLLRAYELLMSNIEQSPLQRTNLNPFEAPECVAAEIFVNELACIGKGCPYSCVKRAPEVFQFAPDTGRARAVNQNVAARGDYSTQLAVGQCPANCIHIMTPQQRLQLEEMLQSILDGGLFASEALILDGLIARAKYENGRYNPPKRKVKRSEKYVDWL